MFDKRISKFLKQRLVDLLLQEYVLGKDFFGKIEELYDSITDLKDRENFYSVLLYILSHLEFSEEEAKKHWKGIIERHNELVNKLGRNISIRTSVIDYFTYNSGILKNPVVIEIFLYDSADLKIYMDEMTGVYNYRYFKEALWAEAKRAERYNLVFSLIIVDIDDLKYINARYGEDQGNVVIKTLAKTIDLNKRAEDVVCRYGGDEFIVLLPETSKSGAIAFMSRIKRKFEDAMKEKDMNVTCSVGISEFPKDTKDPAMLVDLADKSLYYAKLKGKNRIIAYSEDLF
ncbi:MAG: GGDEF domain-containing protein [Brevinematia bacterium]